VTKTLDLLRDATLATLLFVGFAISVAVSIFLIIVDYAGIKEALVRLGGRDEPLGYDPALAWIAERTVLDLTQFSEPSLRAWSIAIGCELAALISVFVLLETIRKAREFGACIGNYRARPDVWRSTLILRATMLPLWAVLTGILAYFAYRLAAYNADLLQFRFMEEREWARNPDLETPPDVPADYGLVYASEYITRLVTGIPWAYYGVVVFSAVVMKTFWMLFASRAVQFGTSFRAWVYAVFAIQPSAVSEASAVPVPPAMEAPTGPQRREVRAPLVNLPSSDAASDVPTSIPAAEPATHEVRRRFSFHRPQYAPPAAAPTDASEPAINKDEMPTRYRVLLSSDPNETVTLDDARRDPERYYVDENDPVRVFDRVGWERLFGKSDE